MEDRELLELAAKAAGYEWRWYGAPLGPLFQVKTHNRVWIFWNPLTNDGDARRLAVKLRLTVQQRDDHAKVGWTGCVEWVGEGWAMCDEHVRGKATRRAIVRAAAEIGKQMP